MPQLTLTPAASLSSSAPEGHDDVVQKDGVYYRKIEKAPSRNRNAKPASFGWQCGQTYALLDDTVDVIRALRCHFCGDVIKLHEQTASNMTCHMKHKHKELIIGLAGATANVSLLSTQSSSVDVRPLGTKQLYFTPDFDKFRKLLVRWCVEDHVAFAKIDTDGFREMMTSINPAVKPYLVTGKTLRSWVKKDYRIIRKAVKLRLKQAKSQRHISFDIWSAPSFKYSFVGVVVHCIVDTEDGPKSQSIQLALRRIKDKHDGDNIAAILLAVLEEYDITANDLGIFMADNEATNDKAIRLVLQRLYPNIKQKEIYARRGRCLAHIINLAAQAFLFGQDITAFESATTVEGEAFDSDKMQAAQEEWRKNGALGKLHNTVQFIFSSSGRRDAWSACVIGDISINGKSKPFLETLSHILGD